MDRPRTSQRYLKSTWTLNHRFLKFLNGRDVRIVASVLAQTRSAQGSGDNAIQRDCRWRRP